MARIGGDEFIVILSSLPEITIAERIADNLLRQTARPLQVGRTEVGVSAGIGIALYPQHGDSAEELIRAADSAIYRIRHQGNNSLGVARALPEGTISPEKNHSEKSLRADMLVAGFTGKVAGV